MKKSLYSSVAAFVLLLSGCGGGDEGSCRFEIQQNLDTGNFDAVIAELGNPSSTCRSAYVNNEWQIDLGAAYMGAAGLGISDVIGLIGTNSGSGATFGTFIDGVSSKQTNTALSSLEQAGSSYTAALNGTLCSDPSLTNSEKDLCLYVGLAETLLATTTVSYLVPDIAALFDGTNVAAQDAAKEELKASACALQFAFDGGIPSICADASSITETPITFTYSDASTRVFRDITVTMAAVPNNTYHRLATATGVTPGTTVVTDGYCSNDFSNPSATWDGTLSPYACPLNKTPGIADQNVTALLVDTLNNGLVAVSGALTSDPALQADIDAYKLEIRPGGGTITVTDIQTYLANTLAN